MKLVEEMIPYSSMHSIRIKVRYFHMGKSMTSKDT